MLAMKELDTTGRVQRMYLEAYARPPKEDRSAGAYARFLDRHGDELGVRPEQRGDDEQFGRISPTSSSTSRNSSS